jgi:hypothetical protein
VTSATVAVLAATVLVAPVSATHGGPHVTLQPDTRGCTGILPSNDGNTDMRVVGGSMEPGGTAIFEISYPVNAGSVGKEFTITDCAFINDVAALKYTVSFVPSNQSFVLHMTLAVPDDAPVGGSYCNYAKTTGSPTASQASQRKAGPACFIIRPPSRPSTASPGAPTTSVTGSRPPTSTGTTAPPDQPVFLPDTAMRAKVQMRHGGMRDSVAQLFWAHRKLK